MATFWHCLNGARKFHCAFAGSANAGNHEKKGKQRQKQDSDDEDSVCTLSDIGRDAGLLPLLLLGRLHTHMLLHTTRPTC